VPVPMESAKSLQDVVRMLDRHCREDGYLFRGQRCEKPLRPKLARLNFDYRRDVVETKMLAEFKRTARPYLRAAPQTDWEWLAIAQHHGLATRLLDWTTNPLAALWFTVHESPEARQPGVLWVFRTQEKDYVDVERDGSPFDIKHTRVFRPTHITQRLVVQSGWFTAHKYLADHDTFGAVEFNPRYKGALRKLTIPADCFWQIRWELDLCGVNAGSLFPDLDGLCRHVEWKYSLLSDETTTKAPAKRSMPDKAALERAAAALKQR
jgi:hypothetical protein